MKDRLPDATTQPTAPKSSERRLLLTISAFTVVIYAAYLCALPNQITDVWWQIRLGDEIRLLHHIPTFDTYSWSAKGTPIILHEWGSCLAFAEAFAHMGGWAGVLLLEILVTSVTLFGLYRLILGRSDGAPFPALMLTLLAGYVCSTSFTPRPQIFTYMFLVSSIAILFRIRQQARSYVLLAILAGIQIFWANMHAAAPIFVLICACYVAGDLIQAAINGGFYLNRPGTLIKSVWGPLACVIVTLASMVVNPNGIHIYSIITDTVGNKTMPSAINEWQPVNFHNLYGHQIEFYLLVIWFVIAATKRKREAGDVIALCLLSVSALYSLRNVPILALAGAPIIAPYCCSAFEAVKERLFKRKSDTSTNPAALNVALVASITFCLVFTIGLIQQIGINKSRSGNSSLEGYAESVFMTSSQPEAACEFIESEKFPLSYRMYNGYDNGAFLIWRLRQFPVFISSETYVYFGPVFDTYIGLEGLPYNWRDRLAAYNPDFVLIGSDDRQAQLFLNAPDWALVYADGSPADASGQPANLIFVKKSVASQKLIDRCRRDCSELKTNIYQGYASAQ